MEEQAKQDQKWLQKNKQVLIISGIVIVLVFATCALLIYVFGWDWTGFSGYNKVTTTHIISGTNAGTVTRIEEYQPGKGLWDWLQLLGILAIPVAAVVLGVWFTGMQQKDQQTAKQQAEENYQLRRFYENINQAYNAAKKVRRLLRAKAQTLTPGQDGIMILIEPYDKQMQALVDVQLQFETLKGEIKSNQKLFLKYDFENMYFDLDKIEKYLNEIIEEYQVYYLKLALSYTKTELPISELKNLKNFIDEKSSDSVFFHKANEVRRKLRERLSSEISS